VCHRCTKESIRKPYPWPFYSPPEIAHCTKGSRSHWREGHQWHKLSKRPTWGAQPAQSHERKA